MLMEMLEKERDCSFEILIRHPLGIICFIIDVLSCGASIDEAKGMLKQEDLTDESRKLLNNDQLMSLLSRQYKDIRDIKTVTTILCALIFHRIPRDIVTLVENQNCA